MEEVAGLGGGTRPVPPATPRSSRAVRGGPTRRVGGARPFTRVGSYTVGRMVEPIASPTRSTRTPSGTTRLLCQDRRKVEPSPIRVEPGRQNTVSRLDKKRALEVDVQIAPPRSSTGGSSRLESSTGTIKIGINRSMTEGRSRHQSIMHTTTSAAIFTRPVLEVGASAASRPLDARNPSSYPLKIAVGRGWAVPVTGGRARANARARRPRPAASPLTGGRA